MLRISILALCLSAATGLAVAPAALRPARAAQAPAASRAAAPPQMALLGSLPLAVRTVAAFPALYALMSVNEYITHRWYQHAEFNSEKWMQNVMKFFTGKGKKIRGGGHVEHHAETYDDMTLKKDDRWRRSKAALSLDNDGFRGTAFTWQVTGLMIVQMLPTTLPVFMGLLGLSLPLTMAIFLPGMLLHAALWNALHPPMHGLGMVGANVGVPSKWLAWTITTRFYKYIYENHQGHHVLGGKCNYNVCCPLTDHLLGTYVPVSKWQPRMRAVPAEGSVERWGMPIEPAGVPQAPIAGGYVAPPEEAESQRLAEEEGLTDAQFAVA